MRARLLWPLLSVALIDEVQGGGPVLAYAELERELGASAAGLMTAVFVVPTAAGLLLEGVLMVALRHWDRGRLVAGALLLMTACQLAVGLAPGLWGLALAISLWGLGSGLSTHFAELCLVEQAHGEEERVLARWTLWGAMGDMGAPLLAAALGLAGLGWRAAIGAGCALSLVGALASLRLPAQPPRLQEDEDEEEGWREALRRTAGRPRLWAWVLAAACCTFLDELFIGLGDIWLASRGQSSGQQGLAFLWTAVGGAVGLLAVERWLRVERVQLWLLACALLCAALLPAWIWAPPGLRPLAGLGLGLAIGPMWPLCTARAYAESPRPAMVGALQSLTLPIEIGAPLLLGLVADRWGLVPALLSLLVQPLVVGLAAVTGSPRRPSLDRGARAPTPP